MDTAVIDIDKQVAVFVNRLMAVIMCIP